MAKINFGEAEKYTTGGCSYLSLKNDGDFLEGRVMLNTIDDIDTHSVHEVVVEGRKRYVDCLRDSYDAPYSDCPLCAQKKNAFVKYYIPIYDNADGQVKMWERGRTHMADISEKFSIAENDNGNIVSHPMRMTRCGVANDKNVTYNFDFFEADEVTLDELPEIPKTPILSMTAQEMANLDTADNRGFGNNSFGGNSFGNNGGANSFGNNGIQRRRNFDAGYQSGGVRRGVTGNNYID